jgi:thiol-disulfide isomerase/thioredoxin
MAIAMASPAVAISAPAPKVAIRSLAQLATPLPYPYDPTADGEAQLAAARGSAQAHGKLLLIDLGGNWCADCRILAAVMERPEVAAFLKAHYEVVSIDIGRLDKNMQIPARYGVTAVEGVPALLIVDARGHLLNKGHVAALADARAMTPRALADWLAGWTR